MTDAEALQRVWKLMQRAKGKAEKYREAGSRPRRDLSIKDKAHYEKQAGFYDADAEALLRVLELAQNHTI